MDQLESRDSSFRPWRPQTRTQNVVLTETPRFDGKQTRVRFPVVAQRQTIWRTSFARGGATRADTFHFMLC